MKQKLCSQERRFAWVTWGLLVAGFILHAWLWAEGAPQGILEPSPTGIQILTVEDGSYEARRLGDQVQLLKPATEFAQEGTLPAWSKRSSGGGFIPGGLLPLLIGTPLILIPDYKSASFVLILADLIAIALLVHVMVSAAGWRFAAIFTFLFWLSPWRLFHSGFLWEPAFLFLPSAAHLWASWRQRNSATLGGSFTLGVTLSCVIQLHLSGFILWVLTALLVTSRLIRLRANAFFLGLALGSATLIPLVISLIEGNPIRLPTASPSEPFNWLEAPLRIFRAAIYWFRLGGGDIGRRITESTSFTTDMDPFTRILFLTSASAALFAFFTNVWLWRRRRRPELSEEQGFLARYSGLTLVAILVASGLSPVTPQGWHLMLALISACIPVALWLDSATPFHRRGFRTLVTVILFMRFPIVFLIGTKHPFYNLG